MTTITIHRLDDKGAVRISDAAAMVHRFVELDPARDYDRWGERSPPDRIVAGDVSALNRFMRARTAHTHWEHLINDPAPAWLAAVPSAWDAATITEDVWRQRDGEARVYEAFAAMIGPYRNLAVVSKVLHLKRPRLIPILDALVVEQIGGRGRDQAPSLARAALAARMVSHLGREARANQPALSALQAELEADGIRRSQMRLLDILLWLTHPAVGLIRVDRHVTVARA